MRYLIVNADDFGLSSSINQAIIRAHREGILTTASLMVNESGFNEAVEFARQNPSLGVGLHLTLLDGHSALSAAEIPGLVNEQREFCRSPVRAGCRYFVGLKSQLRAEILAQFEKFRATGLTLDHVNSHHHVHSHPVIFDILMELAGKLGIQRLRLVRETIRLNRKLGFGSRPAFVIFALFHQLMARRALPRLRDAGIIHNDYVFGLLQTGQVNERYLTALLPVLPRGVSEVYSHPCPGSAELEALISPSIRALIGQLAIRPICYQDISSLADARLTPNAI